MPIPGWDKPYKDLSKLVTTPAQIELVLAGKKTQQRRENCFGEPGMRFEIAGRQFELVRVENQRLGDLTDQDALKEGFPDLRQYQEFIQRIHGGGPGSSWNPDSQCWMHEFKKVG
ncbi:MAG: ASCH domain-containing protein [Acidobacteriia bacterium]|nr:ASCH domain-containing protein [Terriglobia bacterium]